MWYWRATAAAEEEEEEAAAAVVVLVTGRRGARTWRPRAAALRRESDMAGGCDDGAVTRICLLVHQYGSIDLRKTYIEK